MPISKGSTLIEVTVVGPDRKGVVADITNFIFKSGGNIEKVNQNVVRGFFGMHLEASFAEEIVRKQQLDIGLKQLAER
ncbi:MAG: ACT domain-containing protein, partial [Nitrososphaera sp.]